MVAHVAILFGLGEQVEVGLNEGRAATEEEGDLRDLELFGGELCAA